MICKSCKNLLRIEKVANKFQYICINCQSVYGIPQQYSMIYEESVAEKINDKKGGEIFFLQCNPKEWKKCPECKVDTIVAFEREPQSFVKIFGCGKCDTVWKENYKSSKVKGGDSSADEKISLSQLLESNY
jgi:DNA-directed RNA polymerase subunit M/transcription elongation factor TFIIS